MFANHFTMYFSILILCMSLHQSANDYYSKLKPREKYWSSKKPCDKSWEANIIHNFSSWIRICKLVLLLVITRFSFLTWESIAIIYPTASIYKLTSCCRSSMVDCISLRRRWDITTSLLPSERYIDIRIWMIIMYK